MEDLKMETRKIQRPFSIEEWKNGARVETRDGRPVRILCTDKKSTTPIVYLSFNGREEQVHSVLSNGLIRTPFSNLSIEKTGLAHPNDLVIVEEINE